MHQPIHIVGAGGIGCAVGYALCASGASVTFIDADPAKVAWGRSHGVGVLGQPSLPATFLPFDEWTPPRHAAVILCTKCYDNPVVLHRLPPDVPLIPIQNGFDPRLASRTGAVEGIASFVSECPRDRAITRITRAGRLHLGGDGGPLLALLRSTSLFRVEPVPDIRPYKYTKLMYNAAISPLAAAAGLDNGELLRLPQARRLFFELLRENYAIIHGAGIPLARIGPFHPATVQRILRRRSLANALAWAFYPSLRRTYCSMSGDIQRGRTEIDFYNGHLIELAQARPCSLNRAVYDLVKRMERDRAMPHVGVLDELEDVVSDPSRNALSSAL